MAIRYLILLSFLLGSGFLQAQAPTIGTLYNSPQSLEGYTLFGSSNNTQTYLINNCGQVINRWVGSAPPGLSAYLLQDGSLIRTMRILNNNMSMGGLAGGLERFDWGGTLLWSYRCSGRDSTSHHDLDVLPNGNILLLAAYSKSISEAVAQGRDSNINNDTILFSESILEIEPIGTDSGRVVWRWNLWDHLIQDQDSSKPNYGIVSEHPERMNINYIGSSVSKDWMHSNSISYNPTLDQIAIGFRNTNELWIIDHSTTPAEAASSSGGRYRRGGEILYRWGNPATYNQGTSADQHFFGQHGVRWIPDSLPSGGQLIVFNNGHVTGISSVETFMPPSDSAGFYTRPAAGNAFGPTAPTWLYSNSSDPIFYANRLSSAQRLSNGNTLICSGVNGYFVEVDSLGNAVWAYRSPVTGTGLLAQGVAVNAGVNSVFNALRYGPDYIGFLGRSLIPMNPIELNYDISHCQLYNSMAKIEDKPVLKVFPNPASQELFIETDITLNRVEIYDILGKRLKTMAILDDKILVSDLPTGFYTLIINSLFSQRFSIAR